MTQIKTKPAQKTRETPPERLSRLLAFDQDILAGLGDNAVLIGIDEVGRGCLMGPVVSAAVALPLAKASQLEHLLGLDDSKKISLERRQLLDAAIRDIARVTVASASVEEIDAMNIYQAARLAFRRALEALIAEQNLPEESIFVLVDGNAPVPSWPASRQKTVVKGDACSASIAAASVIAKVYRDRIATQLAQEYPYYRWESNMGYGTPDHLEGIRTHGVTPYHRKRFISRYV